MRGRLLLTRLSGGLGASFWTMWTGLTVSAVGTQVSLLALPLVAVVLLDAGAADMGFLRAAGIAPGIVLGLVAGAVVDRVSRRRLLIAVHVVLAATLATVPLAHALDALTLAQLFAVSATTAAAAAFAFPALAALVPSLVREEQLPRANSLVHMAFSAASLSGILAGALVETLGAPAAIMVDVASYLVSLVCLLRVPEPPPVLETAPPRILESVREGVAIITRSPVLRSLVSISLLWTFPGQMAVALYALFVIRLTGDEAALVLGLLLGLSGGIGMIAGSLLVPHFTARVGLGGTVVGGVVLNVLSIFFIPIAAGPVPLAVALLVAGATIGPFGYAAYRIGTATIVQQAAPAAALGRAFATIGVVSGVAALAGSVLGGLLGEALGLREALWVAAVLHLPMVAWLVATPLRRPAEAAAAGA